MENRIQPHWFSLSESVYRAMMALYPAEFRQDYAGLMAQAFRDVSRETYRREGLAGIALWWGAALFDLLISLIEQRRKESFVMSKSILPQWAGKLLMMGGICLGLSSISQLELGIPGLYLASTWFVAPAYVLIGFGVFGLPARYREKTEPLTRITLYVASVGALAATIGFGLSSMGVEIMWAAFMIGMILHLIGMTVFGFANITRPILPMIRWLPILTGLLPFLMIYSEQMQFNSGQTDGADWIAFVCLLGAGVVWLIMGVFINRGAQAEAPQPAAA